LIYILNFVVGAGILMSDAVAQWGDPPTWISDNVTLVSITGAFIAVLYGFQLIYSPLENWDIWLHHVATSVLIAFSMSAPYFLGSGDIVVLAYFGSTWAWCLRLTALGVSHRHDHVRH
jgi:hypothetical protein